MRPNCRREIWILALPSLRQCAHVVNPSLGLAIGMLGMPGDTFRSVRKPPLLLPWHGLLGLDRSPVCYVANYMLLWFLASTVPITSLYLAAHILSIPHYGQYAIVVLDEATRE